MRCSEMHMIIIIPKNWWLSVFLKDVDLVHCRIGKIEGLEVLQKAKVSCVFRSVLYVDNLMMLCCCCCCSSAFAVILTV